MPLYEYQCQDCGTRSEVLQRFSDDPLTTCKECGGTLKKLISAPAVQFKGTGWYVTDYAGKSGGKDSGDKKSASSDGGSSDSKSSGSSSSQEPKSSSASSSGSSGSGSTASKSA